MSKRSCKDRIRSCSKDDLKIILIVIIIMTAISGAAVGVVFAVASFQD